MDYEMFTDKGNAMVHGIVVAAKHKGLSWAEVYDMLVTISKIDGYGEATDTAVRECVYNALNVKSNFYI